MYRAARLSTAATSGATPQHYAAAVVAFALTLVASVAQGAVSLNYERLYETGPLTFEQAQKRAGWRLAQNPVTFGDSAPPVWLRYRLPERSTDMVLYMDNPWLRRFDVLVVAKGRVLETYASGITQPFSARPLPAPAFAYPVPPEADFVYVQQIANATVAMPARFLDVNEFNHLAARLNLLHGLYYGGVLLMLTISLSFWYHTRDRANLLYGLWAGSLGFFAVAADGTGSMYLWPDLPALHHSMTAIAWAGSAITLMYFAAAFLRLSGNTLKMVRVLQGTIALVGVWMLIDSTAVAYGLQVLMSVAALGLLVWQAALACQTGDAGNRLFLLSKTVLACSIVVAAFAVFGVLPLNHWTLHAVHIGAALELVLAGYALSLRFRDAQQTQWQALAESRRLEQHNQELRAARSLAEEHRQLQKSLQQAQKLKTIGQLAGGFAHDFNNILASVLGFAELARMPAAQNDRAKQARYLREIEKAGERGASLVRQLLLYSRNTTPTPQRVNLMAALRQFHELMRSSLPATVEIQIDVPPQGSFLRCDPEQLQQLLVNLCLNAAEAMGNRGTIQITSETTMVRDVTCSSCLTRFSGEYVALKVLDSGRGIQGNASDLFTPFHTTKDVGQGTGLGLSVVHGICHENGGHIHASNRATRGARFAVYLPVSDALDTAAHRPELALHRNRILVIEDEPSVASYLESLLRDAEFVPVIRRQPTQALETFVADPDGYDLVITDHLMPEGTGLDLAEDLRALRPDLPIILTTGNTNNLGASDVRHAAIQAVFQKPLNSEQLLAKIRGLLATE